MALIKQQGEDHVSRFFGDIEEWLPAYNAASSFGYVALVEGDTLIVRAGRLLLNTEPSDHERGFLRSTSIAAGHVDLTVLGLSPTEFLEHLTTDGIATAGGRLRLPPDVDAYSSFYLPIQNDRLSANSNRVSMLHIAGRRQVQMPKRICSACWRAQHRIPMPTPSSPRSGAACMLLCRHRGISATKPQRSGDD